MSLITRQLKGKSNLLFTGAKAINEKYKIEETLI